MDNFQDRNSHLAKEIFHSYKLNNLWLNFRHCIICMYYHIMHIQDQRKQNIQKYKFSKVQPTCIKHNKSPNKVGIQLNQSLIQYQMGKYMLGLLYFLNKFSNLQPTYIKSRNSLNIVDMQLNQSLIWYQKGKHMSSRLYFLNKLSKLQPKYIRCNN